MKIKVSDTTPPQLDWLVAKCEGLQPLLNYSVTVPHPYYEDYDFGFTPSEDWSQGGPIIEREKIELEWVGSEWLAWCNDKEYFAPTPLVAAMRCFVASRLGTEVEVPDDLT